MFTWTKRLTLAEKLRRARDQAEFDMEQSLQRKDDAEVYAKMYESRVARLEQKLSDLRALHHQAVAGREAAERGRSSLSYGASGQAASAPAGLIWGQLLQGD